jgi:hypothetical protein
VDLFKNPVGSFTGLPKRLALPLITFDAPMRNVALSMKINVLMEEQNANL